MRRSKRQMLLLFFVIQFVSMAVAGGISTVLSASQVNREIDEGFLRQRLTALDLAKRTQMTAQEIISTLSLSAYPMRIAEEGEAEFTSRQLEQLQLGGSVDTWERGHGGSYFYLRASLVVIEPQPYNAMFMTATLRGFLSNLIMTAIVLLIFSLGAKRLVQSAVDLSEAARQVAAGNFDVRVSLTSKKGFIRPTVEEMDMAESFNQMADELKSIEYLRRDFTANVSHEIKTPIASISGYAQLLSGQTISDSDRKEYVEAIHAEAGKLASLSDNLLKLTRLESQKIQPPGHRFSLDEQLRRIVGALYPEIERKKIEISSDLSKTYVKADRELLEQVWQNLLGNAVKFTATGGAVNITIEKSDKNVTVHIKDNGIGMDDDTMSRIYEKFFQADVSHKSGGNGLGLPLVKRILDIYGGSIDVTSELGHGTVFTVSLPDDK